MRHTTAASFLLAVVTLVLPAAPVSAARVLYVAGNGTDNGQCGPATRACRSLGQALALASQGDRIVVGPATYVGFQLTKAVTLESALGAGATVIQGSEPVIDVIAGAPAPSSAGPPRASRSAAPTSGSTWPWRTSSSRTASSPAFASAC